MASIAFQPGTAPIEALTGSPGQQPAPGAPTTDPNQAQNAPAPQDTVVLTGKISETVLNGENQNGSQFQEAAIFFSVREMFIGQGNSAPGAPQPEPPPQVAAQPQPPQEPQPAQPANVQAIPANNADPAIAAAVAANAQAGGNPVEQAGAGPTTPQEQLQQLDQTLKQLGINPQSISLFNRMAMLLYANNPAALRVMVQEIQGAAVGANGATGNQQPAQARVQASSQDSGQAPPANPPQAQVQPQAAAPAPAQVQNPNFAGGAPIELAIAQFTFTETQAAIQENGAANQANSANQSAANNANSAATANAPSNNATVQFERLQITFSEAAVQQSQPAGQNGASNSNSQGQLLNITA
ncbi:MAG TPA: hypothetical protein VJR23_05560 [Candidatus Acidoferrales bacterium]|nr:hypothetical protein [Candidatus Acidoferrales bacterium]